MQVEKTSLTHKKIDPRNMRAKSLTGAVDTVRTVWVSTDGDLLDLPSKVLQVIYQKRVLVFHQGFQTPRNR